MIPPTEAVRRYRAVARTPFRCAMGLALFLVGSSGGCLSSIGNGWLDPTVVGDFKHSRTLEIRNSLTLEDSPSAIPGAEYPTRDDLRVLEVEYPVSAGDTLAVEVFELRQRAVPYQAQLAVSATGYINFPVIGRVHASGLTVPALEEAVADVLRAKEILVRPEVTINPVFLRLATYSIFGIGVSAANNAPLRAGTFPIRHPGLRLLEAINQVGGLSEFVTDIYVFREDEPAWRQALKGAEADEGEDAGDPQPADDTGGAGSSLEQEGDAAGEEHTSSREPAPREPAQDLLDVVLDQNRITDPEGAEKPEQSIPEAFEPEPTDPYIFVDGAFVPNPAHVVSRDAPAMAGVAALDTATPAVNWARIAGENSYRVIRVPAESLRAGDPGMNIAVRAGDVIRIVSGEIGVYYVMGQVNRVGPFAFNAETITIKAAIAVAGGLSRLAWPDRCTVYRRIGQREQMIQVNLDRIFAGKDPDFVIKRGDIINVGTHPLAPFVQSLRGMTIPNPVSNLGYSFTYARNFADIDSFAVQRNPNNNDNDFPPLLPP